MDDNIVQLFPKTPQAAFDRLRRLVEGHRKSLPLNEPSQSAALPKPAAPVKTSPSAIAFPPEARLEVVRGELILSRMASSESEAEYRAMMSWSSKLNWIGTQLTLLGFSYELLYHQNPRDPFGPQVADGIRIRLQPK